MYAGGDILIEFDIVNELSININTNYFIKCEAELYEKKTGVLFQKYSTIPGLSELEIYRDNLLFRLYIEKNLLINKTGGELYLGVSLYSTSPEVSGGVYVIKENIKLEKVISNEL